MIQVLDRQSVKAFAVRMMRKYEYVAEYMSDVNAVTQFSCSYVVVHFHVRSSTALRDGCATRKRSVND